MRRTTQDKSMLSMCLLSVGHVLVPSDNQYEFFFLITGASRAAVNPRTDGSPLKPSSSSAFTQVHLIDFFLYAYSNGKLPTAGHPLMGTVTPWP